MSAVNKPSKITIAVASDLHAFVPSDTNKAPPSYLPISGPPDPFQHPIEGLKVLIRDCHLTADLLLCPGDMGDKADQASQYYVWEQLQNLKNALGAPQALATAGNHDMDSRYSTEFDAKGILQSLIPPFPGLSEVECDRYWSRNFVVHEQDAWRIETKLTYW